MITVSFNCKNHGNALLLVCLYDILTVKEVGDSISMIDHAAWLVDEIGDRLDEIDDFDGGGQMGDGLAKQVTELYRRSNEDASKEQP